MSDLPIMLRVEGKRCLVVGGGGVALRRAEGLTRAGAVVTVVAPSMDVRIKALPVTCVERGFEVDDLRGVFVVVIATDDAHVNQFVHDEARKHGALVNRTDDPASGDFSVAAHEHAGPITLSVHTSGISAAAAATIRDELLAHLDPHWKTLLETIAPYRAKAQARIADTRLRQTTLARFASPEAMHALRTGGPEALGQFCDSVLAEDSRRQPPEDAGR
ncbi:MAG: hypothetical protein GC164_12650 [Phycisphaera sp.]|nr:hypothetical protein [Phycisphaera sp.]